MQVGLVCRVCGLEFQRLRAASENLRPGFGSNGAFDEQGRAVRVE